MMNDQALLQAYRARLPRRASDAEFIDDDAYSDPVSQGDQETSQDPRGLVDRLYSEQLSARPAGKPGMGQAGMGPPPGMGQAGMGQMGPPPQNRVPSTKRTYLRL